MIRIRHAFLAGVAAVTLAPAAHAQTALEDGSTTNEQTNDPNAGDVSDPGTIVVTARKREETLQDVPVAVTAITGDVLSSRGINSVREAAVLAPGLNINSDGSGRAFVAIRGVGVTLV